MENNDLRLDLLVEAQGHWNAMAPFREERERCKRYTYGSQWDDLIYVDGRYMRESEYIRSQGNIPLKNNLIRRIVRNVLGVFRDQYKPPVAADLDLPVSTDSDWILHELDKASRSNQLEELNARTMEEFLVSGLAVQRKWCGEREGVTGTVTDYVQPDYFIIDTDMRDFRGLDASLVGEIHDVDFGQLSMQLASSSHELQRLKEIYLDAASLSSNSFLASAFGSDSAALEFLTPRRPGRCRVIEVWRREARGYYRCHDTARGEMFMIEAKDYGALVENENARRLAQVLKQGLPPSEAKLIAARWLMKERWRYYFLAPTGHVLREGDSPYPDGAHPYVFKAYPFIDGEIHSFVADLIDQQRYVNRLVSLYDWVMRASAKGVLLFPEGSLPDDVDIDEISAEWSKFNGVIMFRPKPGVPLPQQVSGNAAGVGITELLQVQLKMMEDVSGVNSALQGKLEGGAVSGTLYTQQTRHALTGLLDILQSFASFLRAGFRKEAALISAYMKRPQEDEGKKLQTAYMVW